MRFAIVGQGLAAALILWTGTGARADDDDDLSKSAKQTLRVPRRGFEAGLRTGYTLAFSGLGNPTSTVGASQQLGDYVTGFVPIWVDAGYRLNRGVYVGWFFRYDVAVMNGQAQGCGAYNTSNCSAFDVQVGVAFRYHVLPKSIFNPWLGAGAGYEIFSYGYAYGYTGQAMNRFSGDANGWIGNVELGVDYKPAPTIGVGPFVMVGVGRYTSCGNNWSGYGRPLGCSISEPAEHELVTMGVRGVYDFGW